MTRRFQMTRRDSVLLWLWCSNGAVGPVNPIHDPVYQQQLALDAARHQGSFTAVPQ
jgi:hypothetical protein